MQQQGVRPPPGPQPPTYDDRHEEHPERFDLARIAAIERAETAVRLPKVAAEEGTDEDDPW